MVAVTYGALKSRILSEIDTNDSSGVAIYGSAIGDAIVTAINFYSDKKFWFLEKTDTITLLSGNRSVALPSDYKSIISLRLLNNNTWQINGSGFDLITYSELKENAIDNVDSGLPDKCAIFGSNLYVNKAAGQNYTIEVNYYKGDVTLPSSDGDTSVWFDEAQDLIRYKALAVIYRDFKHAENKAAFYENSARDFATSLLTRNNTRQSVWRLKSANTNY